MLTFGFIRENPRESVAKKFDYRADAPAGFLTNCLITVPSVNRHIREIIPSEMTQ
jgi:hypothetical protein